VAEYARSTGEGFCRLARNFRHDLEACRSWAGIDELGWLVLLSIAGAALLGTYALLRLDSRSVS
jgi:hypothetical protein